MSVSDDTITGLGCGACADGISPPFKFSMAFQPVVDVDMRLIYAYEALVRGPDGEPAHSVLRQVTPANRYAFDQSCRIKAITLANELGLRESGAILSVNFMPGAMYQPENCVRATLAAARRYDMPSERLAFELTENEQVTDFDHLREIFRVYRKNQFRTAIDDFGTGFSGLNLLANFQADIVKIDMALVCAIDTDGRRRTIVAGIVDICRRLSIQVVAEGVETRAELDALRLIGISLFQGHLFAKAGFEALPKVAL